MKYIHLNTDIKNLVITNSWLYFSPFFSPKSIFTTLMNSDGTNPWLQWTHLAGSKLFVTTEFECTFNFNTDLTLCQLENAMLHKIT